VVSMASGSVISGKIVVSRRASIDLPPAGRASGDYDRNASIRFCFAKDSRDADRYPR
jgi:hypothetical protein